MSSKSIKIVRGITGVLLILGLIAYEGMTIVHAFVYRIPNYQTMACGCIAGILTDLLIWKLAGFDKRGFALLAIMIALFWCMFIFSLIIDMKVKIQ